VREDKRRPREADAKEQMPWVWEARGIVLASEAVVLGVAGEWAVVAAEASSGRSRYQILVEEVQASLMPSAL
jgi:hypothetical protein